MLTAHVVAHTHWDREWYHPFVRFRQRLVALVDELLDDPPPPHESFLLDGQAIVIEDYLEVRPERAAELASLLRSGRLEAGPWYVLADELIPSGEAIVRNLLLGRRVLGRLRAPSPPVLYCPDSFGHPAALPVIAAGFGLPLTILWRGFGGRRWPFSDTVRWHHASGDSVILYHLPPNGYEYASDLPVTKALAEDRWTRIRDELAPRSATSVVLLPNGADHHARQQRQHEAVRALKAAARHAGDTVRPSSLSAFAKHVVDATASWNLPVVTGELRDSYGYTWTLQGTLATRAAQKRANARAERSLLRDAEPWAALARQRGASSRRPLVDAAWRTLLEAHPHDTLCGCSIDVVAEAMQRRLADAHEQSIGIRDDALANLVGHDVVAARTAKSAWIPTVMVRNRAARSRRGVAIVELKQWVADVAVGPGSAPTPTPALADPPLPAPFGGSPLQILHHRRAYDRIESPRHYPDNDLVAVTRAAVWVDGVPGYGVRAIALGSTPSPPHPLPRRVEVGDTGLANGLVRVTVRHDGRVDLEELSSERCIDDLLLLEDRMDLGDLYTPSIRGTAASAEYMGARVIQRGPLIGELRLRWVLRSDAGEKSTFTASIALASESPLVRISVGGVNRQRDHRLRIALRTGLTNAEVWADAAFGAIRREPIQVPNEDQIAEAPPSTAPLHRYVSMFSGQAGVTVFSDGLAEYETTEAGYAFVTLLRAVGELSRNDVPERPGHAGWPAPTPRAQSLGRYAARFALLLHGPRIPTTIHAIEEAADDVLLPLEGRTLRSALAVPPPVHGVELEGIGLAFSACKEAENGEQIVVRCVNLLDQPVAGSWRFGVPPREAFRARLDETPIEPVRLDAGTLAFVAPPHGVLTFLVR